MENETGTAYVDVVVRDGSTISVRRAGTADADALLAFLGALSPDSLYQRFLGHTSLARARVEALAAADDRDGAALVAESGGRIVGFAGFYTGSPSPERAEVALAVADAWHGHGVGTRLLELLCERARGRGLETFEADVLGSNSRMLELFQDSGFELRTSWEGDTCHVVLSIADSLPARARAAARAQAAAATSMRPFFEPKVVAVVGASRRRGRIGSELLHNLVSTGFRGTIVPVHPVAAELEGLRTCARVTDIPGPVDLAVVVVPGAEVPAVIDDCIAKGVPALCIISAGFSEGDAAGRAREAALVARIRHAGVRLVGPNCMGLLNTDSAVRLNATFSPVYPPSGSVAMSSQSGALGLAILDHARRLGIGISSFVSVGNKADVSGNDLIQYWADDPNTSVILLYLESFGNPKKFTEIARRVARTKPIVAVKAGRSGAGARAARSHTGALASNDALVDALFHQSGVIRTDGLADMFDVASLLAHQPLPRGRRVAVLTNAGGPGILAADACEAHGLELPSLGDATRATLGSFLPEAASVANPVDMLASAPPEHYRKALRALLLDDAVDSVIAIFIPPLVTQPEPVAGALAEAAAAGPEKPVLGVFIQSGETPAALAPIPSFAFPEAAALALARTTAYARWRERPPGVPPSLAQVDRSRAQKVVQAILARGGGWASPAEALDLIGAVGIATPPSRIVTTVEEAVGAASEVAYPVAVKALGPTLLHKTERRAVTLNVHDEAGIRRACADFGARLGPDMTGLLVQAMVPTGVEMIVGAVQDPVFGPLVACGTGGVFVDLLADTAFRLHPLTEADAGDMIEELRGARLLRGFRGAPAADEAALRDIVLRVSALLSAGPEIAEVDLNPVIVLPNGAVAADARIRVERPQPPPSGRRIQY